MINTGQVQAELRVLERAKSLIEKGWTQEAYGRGEDGRSVRSGDLGTTGVCFCALGAGIAADQQLGSLFGRDKAEVLVSRALGFDPKGDELDDYEVVVWNDAEDRTQEEVVARFNESIERWKGRLA